MGASRCWDLAIHLLWEFSRIIAQNFDIFLTHPSTNANTEHNTHLRNAAARRQNKKWIIYTSSGKWGKWRADKNVANLLKSLKCHPNMPFNVCRKRFREIDTKTQKSRSSLNEAIKIAISVNWVNFSYSKRRQKPKNWRWERCCDRKAIDDNNDDDGSSRVRWMGFSAKERGK